MNESYKEKELWSQIVADLRLQNGVGDYAVDYYISGLTLIKDTGTQLIIEYPEGFLIDWIEMNYKDYIIMTAARLLDGARQIDFVQAKSTAQEPTSAPEPKKAQPAAAKAPQVIEPVSQAAVHSTKAKKTRHQSNLNPDYTFRNFVVGPNNEYACKAAKAVAESPSPLYNPFYIYGDSGLGKTHLLHAIGNAIQERDPSKRVLYVTSEEFGNDYIEAVSKGITFASFRSKYRKADVLLIDDIQFLGSKEKTQEEFFHTFNALFSSNKQIVLTSDCPSSEITSISDRLNSRFEQGMTVGVHAPGLETRQAILRQKRKQMKNNIISDEVLDYLAENITRSVRRLEGALMRLAVYSSISHASLSLADVRIQLKDLFGTDEKTGQLSIQDIQNRVADIFEVPVKALSSRSRIAKLAHPRQIAMYLSRKFTELTLKDIGKAFGGRDHGTVIHATKVIETKLEEDPALRDILNRITSVSA